MRIGIEDYHFTLWRIAHFMPDTRVHAEHIQANNFLVLNILQKIREYFVVRKIFT